MHGWPRTWVMMVISLMQRAGRAAWDLLRQRWPDARQVLVACGTGNNGGDGYVLACLAHRAGLQVQVVHLPGRGPASLLAQRAYDAYLAAGGQVMLFSGVLETADVLVDALFGIGLNRPLDVPTQGLINALNAAGRPVLALDVPSGVDAERGAVFGTPVCAHVTLQFMVPHGVCIQAQHWRPWASVYSLRLMCRQHYGMRCHLVLSDGGHRDWHPGSVRGGVTATKVSLGVCCVWAVIGGAVEQSC